jgi:hypothetical protein
MKLHLQFSLYLPSVYIQSSNVQFDFLFIVCTQIKLGESHSNASNTNCMYTFDVFVWVSLQSCTVSGMRMWRVSRDWCGRLDGMGKANVARARHMRIHNIMALLKKLTSVLLGLILYQFMLSKFNLLYPSVSCYATGSYNREVTALGMCCPPYDLSYSRL